MLSDTLLLHQQPNFPVTIPFLTGVLSDVTLGIYQEKVNCHNPLLNRGAFRQNGGAARNSCLLVTIPFLTGVLSDFLYGIENGIQKVTIPFLTGVLSDFHNYTGYTGVLGHNHLLNRGAFRRSGCSSYFIIVTIPFLTGVLSDLI